jgi:ABC-type nitrate/sulfonate/bicarbonate transport system substrate-binding protein
MRIALTLLVSTALLWAVPARAGSRQVRILVPSRDNLQFVTFWVARRAGCFARQQIETELVIPPVNREIIPAMLNAEELVAVMPPPSLLEALAAGADVVAVANLLRNEAVDLVVRRDVIEQRALADSATPRERLERLRGARIGVAAGPLTRLRGLLDHFSLGDDHFEVVIIRGQEQNEAIEKGRVDGLLCHTPYLERALLYGNAQVVVDLVGGEIRELARPQIHSLVVQRSLIERDRGLVEALVRAVACGAEAARQTERTTEWLQQEFPSREPKEIALFARLYQPAIPRTLTVSASGLQAMLESSPASHAPPDLSGLVWERHVDPSFASALEGR